jgi:molecular chaperone IbpA
VHHSKLGCPMADHEYLHQGISARPFERQFNLEDHIEVEGASFENGLLEIELARKIPEAMKPRRIEIGAGASTRKTERMKTVEQVHAA